MFAAIVLAVGGAGTVGARDMSPIDRLGDQGPMAGRQVTTTTPTPGTMHMHQQLGVPTFLWGQRGGAVGGSAAAVAAAVSDDPVMAARAYFNELASLYALPRGHTDTLQPAYTQQLANGAVIVKFRNRINGIDVFAEEASVLLSPARKLVAIGGFLTGGDGSGAYGATAAQAAAVALADWSFGSGTASSLQARPSRGDYEYFDLPVGATGTDGSRLAAPVRVQKVLYRLPGQLVPAYYVEVQMHDALQRDAVDYYAYVIAATDLSVLVRHNQTSHAAFSYRVFAEAGGNNMPLPGPTGRNGFPSPTATPDGYQGPYVMPNLVTLQNVPFSRNDPWLAPAETRTIGNNVDAFANLVEPDEFGPADPVECDIGVPPTGGDFHACTNTANTFDYTFDPAKAPNASKTQVMAAVTNLFYMNNWLHDWYYDAGFDEASGNAQQSNYGRGGEDEDPIIAEAQDYSSRNNADMKTPSDGGSPRMRMFVWQSVAAKMTKVSVPTTIAGVKPSGDAQFGPQAYDVTGDVIYASPNDGCTTFTNAAAVTGRIALIDRTAGCTFEVAVKNAQNAGAIGVIVADSANNAAGVGTMPGTDVTVTIASRLVSLADGAEIKSQLPGTVTVRLARIIGVDRDGTMDNGIIAHEWGHYISSRLIANARGLRTNQAAGLGEGWADFHALLLLVKGADAALPSNARFNGAYSYTGYALGGPDLAPDVLNTAFYYGSRRYPYSRDLAKNPLTFKHVTKHVALPAVPPPAFGAGGADNAEVHNTGEVWGSMLWQCYSNLLNDTARLSFAEAQDRMKNYLVAAYKMTPANPTLIEARDALLAVMGVRSLEDETLCLQGFALRGAGPGAVAPDRFSQNNAGVVESFAMGGIRFVSATLSDRPLFCNADDVLDNGETGTLTVTLQNMGPATLSTTTGTVVSSNAHIQFPSSGALIFPASAPGQTVSASVPVKLVGAVGREGTDFTIALTAPGLPALPAPSIAPFPLNFDVTPRQSATDDVESAHTVWNPAYKNPGAALWRRIALSATDHRWAVIDAAYVSNEWLVSPPLNVAATGNFTFTFRHRHNYDTGEFGDYDGGLLAISADLGANWTLIPGSALSPSYNGTISTGSMTNPYAGQPAYLRTNASYPAQDTVTVDLGAAYRGKTVMIAFISATDRQNNPVEFTGWELDDLAFSNITNKPFDRTSADAGACVSITPQAGTPQSTALNRAFGVTLKAIVKSADGSPMVGLPVTFTLPGAGASAIFGGAATVITDASGVATATTLTANATMGSYNATATAGLATTTFALTNVGPPIIVKAFGDPALALNATTTLSFTITNPAANTVALTGIGFADEFTGAGNAPFVVAAPNRLFGSCGGGTITAIPGATSVTLTGATLPVNGSCTFSIGVTPTQYGTATNRVTVTSANGGSGNTAFATVQILPHVIPVPVLQGWGPALLSLLLAGLAWGVMGRRGRRN